jgi:mannose-6-phosphate isomerase
LGFKHHPMLNYPLKFQPILKEKIWGGNKLVELLHKETQKSRVGESWEISDVEGDTSIVANGNLKGKSLRTLLKEYKGELMGEKAYKTFGNRFPLLIKFIDANTELSVQLHPNDRVAKERHNSFGKTEMWYIMAADEHAEIIVGFKKNISKAEYLKQLNSGNITELLNFEQVKEGDAFFINPGKVHAIGAGVLLAEIQQTSDITYRIYDWDRTDADGKSRDLHTDLALDIIDFEFKKDFKKPYTHSRNTSNNIVTCEYFTTNFLPISGGTVKKNYTAIDSFVIYMCVRGAAEISVYGNSENIEQGQTVFIPAKSDHVELFSKAGAELLEIYLE